MLRLNRRDLLSLTMATALMSPVFAQAAAPQEPLVIKMVKPGFHMIIGAGGNASARVGSNAVFLVDTKFAGGMNYDHLVAEIGKLSDKPVRYVFITHNHPDHSGNIAPFVANGVPVVGHEGLPALLAKTAREGSVSAVPTVTYRDNYRAERDGLVAEAHHYAAAAHTSADTVVYFPDVRVVALGDELTDLGPMPDYASGGSMGGYIASLDKVLALDFDMAVPGHGNNAFTKSEVRSFRDKTERLLNAARGLVKAGVPKEQLLEKLDIASYGWEYPGRWNAPGRAEGLYAEASK